MSVLNVLSVCESSTEKEYGPAKGQEALEKNSAALCQRRNPTGLDRIDGAERRTLSPYFFEISDT